MRELKIVGAAACGLMAVGSLFSLLGGLQSAGGASNTGFLIGRIASIIVLGALAVWLWRQSTRRSPPQ